MTRSYANRLILLFSVLLVVPLVLLYALLSGTLESRVAREQRSAAEAALSSAQRVLGEYVLTLEPGFGLETAIDDEILVWLSRVIGHDVSLYWGSEVYASSKRELFAAGLLPRRIPGEVWPRMALSGENEASRTARTGSAEYVELYAPLAVPGFDSRQTRLFLSMPLLAQQEEATVETALIRRRTLLATLAVFLLLAALGTRLARAFTRPIMELVGGTQRIAGGAASLGVKSSVLELAALAEAIDRMARRIAEGREQLLREKRLVEGIIENVTSGVVYLDHTGRVLLANRVARQLLEVAPGDRIADRLGSRPELAEARRFVSARRGELAQSTIRLGGPKGAEGNERDWSLVWVPLAGESEPAALFVVEDISEVLRAQRLEAWAAMAQIIAHEIKNPLTPIRLSTEHLREVWKRDREHFEVVFDRCTENILRQVEELREIATEFSTFSHIPESVRVPGDLAATVLRGRRSLPGGAARRRRDRARGGGREPPGAVRFPAPGSRPAQPPRERRPRLGGRRQGHDPRRPGGRHGGDPGRRPRPRSAAGDAGADLRALLLDPGGRHRPGAVDRPAGGRGARRLDPGAQPRCGRARSHDYNSPAMTSSRFASPPLPVLRCSSPAFPPAASAARGRRRRRAPALWLTPDSGALDAARRAGLAAAGLGEIYLDAAELEWNGSLDAAAARAPGDSAPHSDDPGRLGPVAARRPAARRRSPTALLSELTALRIEAEQDGLLVVGFHFEVEPGESAESLGRDARAAAHPARQQLFVSAGLGREVARGPRAPRRSRTVSTTSSA